MVRQDVKEAILADLAAAHAQRNGNQTSPFKPSLLARCKAVAMLVLLYVVVMPLSVAAVLVATGLRRAWRSLSRGPEAEHPLAQPPHRGTALVSGAHD
jgi:Flp pilus assembly protein TadB